VDIFLFQVKNVIILLMTLASPPFAFASPPFAFALLKAKAEVAFELA
jgi:hypothetical protein